MRMARKTGEEDPQLQASLEQAKRKFDGLLDDVDQDLRAQWQVWDEGDLSARHAAQKTMVALLHRRRYLSNLVRDVTETLELEARSGTFIVSGHAHDLKGHGFSRAENGKKMGL